jgi:hypothetical protein
LRLWQPVADLAGGMRVSWRVFGTVYSRNLTPERETGLGTWSDAEIRRAVTSGIARDGRLMHWQAMPWDHFSNLRLEDLHALTVYLRHVPAVRSAVPAPMPPSPTDAAGDTFFFGYTGRYSSSGSGPSGSESIGQFGRSCRNLAAMVAIRAVCSDAPATLVSS